MDNFRQGAPFLWKYVEFVSSVIQKEAGTIFRNSNFLRKYSISGVSKKTLFFLLNPIIKLYVPVCLSSNLTVQIHDFCKLCTDKSIRNALS